MSRATLNTADIDLPSPTPPLPACRYLVSTDGWTASSKLEKYLLMGSAVLKQASPMIAYYYAAMIPWVHYVPFYEYHKADILGVISWLKENDDAAREMSKNAQRFARLHLNRPARLCYYHELFNRMGNLFRWVGAGCGCTGEG
jgi:hypothetical protein